MRPFLRATLVVLSLLVCQTALASDIVVASWNMKRLGHGDQQSFGALAAIAAKADLVAAQEVMNEEGLARLERALEQHTGESWSTIASHAIGSKSYKEMYAFLWRDRTVEYVDGAMVYLDRGDKFLREPFAARFASKKDGKPFALASVHILYGKGVADRTPEIRALAEFWVWMGEIYENTPRLLVGDFNLPPTDPAWGPLKQHAKPLITRGATTLSSVNGRYANLYDNIWIEPDTALPISASGIVDYPKMLGWDHEKARRHVSDHAPVFVALGNARLDVAAVQAKDPGRAPVATRAGRRGHGCGARQPKLQDLPSSRLPELQPDG